MNPDAFPHIVRVTSLQGFLAEMPAAGESAAHKRVVRLLYRQVEGQHSAALLLSLQAAARGPPGVLGRRLHPRAGAAARLAASLAARQPSAPVLLIYVYRQLLQGDPRQRPLSSGQRLVGKVTASPG